MALRIPVHVTSTDPILRTGVATQLRSRPEVELVADPSPAAVCVVVHDIVDDQVLQLARELRAHGNRQVILVVSTIDDAALLSVIETGACGVVARADATPERLVTAVTQASTMGGVLSPKLVGRLLEQVNRLQHQVLAPKGLKFTGLSDREAAVLRMISQGMEVREIAQELSYSERTIKNALHDVVSRFHLRNRTHAVAFAMREGLI
ncbi:helix-turn-helix transcriptional regulator [Actinophytocola algeriensis]|jgi:DNA-binding NarL/FixJ family response regulator|uniref:DNA-binding NarL/FixJ family response regulator n=1 Tax=Actinophytocola algeriensis TaxID=1768010 RepID=A0A7W7VEB5_9PSEU|nr:response regulator transcription factor [Actinophytocola algeriensis]MBB4907047.1 DNA-binding NarL/FixJ family response regulator [Actinophytocola algeriensis]MBE1478530.1 DNA-binding NarL/FixJ family response regulator [Actinophytocola algeriensis]